MRDLFCLIYLKEIEPNISTIQIRKVPPPLAPRPPVYRLPPPCILGGPVSIFIVPCLLTQVKTEIPGFVFIQGSEDLEKNQCQDSEKGQKKD